MCSVYGICKVSDTEIKFKDIVKAYSTLPCCQPQVLCVCYLLSPEANSPHQTFWSDYISNSNLCLSIRWLFFCLTTFTNIFIPFVDWHTFESTLKMHSWYLSNTLPLTFGTDQWPFLFSNYFMTTLSHPELLANTFYTMLFYIWLTVSGVQRGVDRIRCVWFSHQLLQQSVYAEHEELHSTICKTCGRW